MSALTAQQRELLEKLPSSPSDGYGVKGARLTTARNLERKGLAKCVGVNAWTGRCYFVRTATAAPGADGGKEGERG